MPSTTQQIEHIRQGAAAYALDSWGSTARQLALLKVSFPEALTSLAVANSSITCIDCGDPLRKHSPKMKAQERLDELVKDHFDFARHNMLMGAREVRALGGTVEQIQQFIAEHIDCDQEHGCAMHADQERQEPAAPGPVAVETPDYSGETAHREHERNRPPKFAVQ